MATNNYDAIRDENIEVLKNLGIDPTTVMEYGFIHPRDNYGIVVFEQAERTPDGGFMRVGLDDIYHYTRRIKAETGDEIK